MVKLEWTAQPPTFSAELRGEARDGWEDAEMGRSAREIQSLCPGLANLSKGEGQEGAENHRKMVISWDFMVV